MIARAWEILGLSPDASDETIRERYLELVRRFPPERFPEKFAEIRSAYDILKDLTQRLDARFFHRSNEDFLDHLIEDVQCHSPRRRHTLSQLRQRLANPTS